MPPDDSFADMLTRLRAGDEDAAARIFHQFAARLIALARSQLDAALRRKMDPEDVLQSVFRSFFARQASQPYALDDWDGLWSLLARITVRKCGRRLAHFRAQRRDVGREVAARAAPDESAADWEALAREPTPAEAAMLTETVEELLRELSERDRRILVLSLEGCPVAEISGQVGCTERTVYRVLDFIRGRLEAMRDEAGAGEPK
jgi:RNA polymerase sigma-70 factor (ECF subfamily)